MDEKTAFKILGMRVYSLMLQMYGEARRKYGKIKKCIDYNGTELKSWKDCFVYDVWGEKEILIAFYFNSSKDKSTHAEMRRVKIEK